VLAFLRASVYGCNMVQRMIDDRKSLKMEDAIFNWFSLKMENDVFNWLPYINLFRGNHESLGHFENNYA